MVFYSKIQLLYMDMNKCLDQTSYSYEIIVCLILEEIGWTTKEIQGFIHEIQKWQVFKWNFRLE